MSVLKIPKNRFKSYGDAALSVAGINAWNYLPEHIRSVSTIRLFKSKLKTYLF